MVSIEDIQISPGTILLLTVSLSTIGLFIFLCGVPQFLLGTSGPGMGSGANNNWNRYIDMNPPQHHKTSFKMKYAWKFTNEGGVGGTFESPGKDDATGLPLTGHLVGRHTWTPNGKAADLPFDTSFNPHENPNSADKLLRGQQLSRYYKGTIPVESERRGTAAASSVSVDQALKDAISFYCKIQCDDGHWAGDYGGPFFLLPGLVIMCYITGRKLGDAHSDAILVYMKNHQQNNGGWGLHLEGPSTMFGTALHYVAVRILGLSANDPICVKAREFIHLHGGAVGIPSWGKFWLATLGVYKWEGLNSIPPELWLLPNWFPFHPRRMWCHARMVYLPMSFIYGGRFTAQETDLIKDLRQELYVENFDTIDWNKARNTVCQIDLYSPHSKLMDFANELLSYYEVTPISSIRRKALQFCADYMHEEDIQTNYVDIGPVNKVLNMLSTFYQSGAQSEEFLRHSARLADYLWVAEDGMKMQGYNGSQLWDTAFATQAITCGSFSVCGGHLKDKHALSDEMHTADIFVKDKEYQDLVCSAMKRVASYVDYTQIKQDEKDNEKWYRIISKGGWPFSTNDHGWPIADCTAEGLKAALSLRKMGLEGDHALTPERYYDAVNIILNFQNSDGGWATYERNRGWDWFELLNPAEVFGDIMIDYTYIELSSACITGLKMFQEQFPNHRQAEVQRAIDTGVEFVRRQQRTDGSFYGSWAVCFTYGCWFGVEALLAGGEDPHTSKALQNVCNFLISKQNPDGGWGESYLSCVRKQYSTRESTAFQTAWALLSLIGAQCKQSEAVEKGIQFLLARQRETGDWEQESVAGIFNRTCGITYTAYRNVFPIWALNEYRSHYAYAK